MPDEIPSGSVIVTPGDMWSAIQETRDLAKETQASVIELKNLIHPALADVRSDIDKLDQREQKHHDEHGAAIRELQEASWSSRWVPALVSAALTASAGGVLVYILTGGAIN